MKKSFAITLLLLTVCLAASAQVQSEIGLGYSGAGYGITRAAVAYNFNNDKYLDTAPAHCDITVGAFLYTNDRLKGSIYDPVRAAGLFGRFVAGNEKFKVGVESDLELISYHRHLSLVPERQLSINFQPCLQYDITERFALLLNIGSVGFWSEDISRHKLDIDGGGTVLPVEPGLGLNICNARLAMIIRM